MEMEILRSLLSFALSCAFCGGVCHLLRSAERKARKTETLYARYDSFVIRMPASLTATYGTLAALGGGLLLSFVLLRIFAPDSGVTTGHFVAFGAIFLIATLIALSASRWKITFHQGWFTVETLLHKPRICYIDEVDALLKSRTLYTGVAEEIVLCHQGKTLATVNHLSPNFGILREVLISRGRLHS